MQVFGVQGGVKYFNLYAEKTVSTRCGKTLEITKDFSIKEKFVVDIWGLFRL